MLVFVAYLIMVFLIQAQYLIDNSVSRNYSGLDLTYGKQGGKAPSETYRGNYDVSERTADKLDFMGLTRWFSIPNNYMEEFFNIVNRFGKVVDNTGGLITSMQGIVRDSIQSWKPQYTSERIQVVGGLYDVN